MKSTIVGDPAPGFTLCFQLELAPLGVDFEVPLLEIRRRAVEQRLHRVDALTELHLARSDALFGGAIQLCQVLILFEFELSDCVIECRIDRRGDVSACREGCLCLGAEDGIESVRGENDVSTGVLKCLRPAQLRTWVRSRRSSRDIHESNPVLLRSNSPRVTSKTWQATGLAIGVRPR